jgi:hypothetical protein
MIVFILFILFFIYFPTAVFIQLLRITESEDILIRSGLNLGVGIILVTLSAILFGFVGGSATYVYVWLLPVFSVLYLAKQWNHTPWRPWSGISKIQWGILAIILLGIVTQNLVLYRGGWQTGEGYIFPSIHDTMWNIALSTELFHHFPPQHPGMAGEALKNNHFFYPLFLAVIRAITHLNILTIYFQYAPVLVSLLFGLSLYAVSTIYTKRPTFRALSVFLGYFCGNISYVIPLFLGSHFNWTGSTFFTDQPFDQIINPYTVIGFSFFLLGIYTLHYTSTTRQTWSWSILTALIFGSLFGFKSFGGIIAVCALALTTAISLGTYKKQTLLFTSLCTLVIFVPVFFFVTEPGVATISWAPGWLLREMISSSDKLPMTKLLETEIYYSMIGNTLGYIKIKMIELLWYVIGNLGIRLIGVLFLIKMLIKPRGDYKDHHITTMFICSATLIAFCIPLLFNLGANSYNIIQFTPYSLVFLALFTAWGTEWIWEYFSRKKIIWGGVICLGVIIGLAIPVNVKNILDKFQAPRDVVMREEMDALKYLADHTDSDSVLLIDLNQYAKPDKYGKDPMFISALSERRIYLASPGYAKQTGRDPAARMAEIQQFFSTSKTSLLKDRNISYIYLLKPYALPMKELSLKVFYENPAIIVYKVEKG